MIPFSLFEQASKFDPSDIAELKKNSNYLRIFEEILHPERIAYVNRGEIEIEGASLVSLVHDADYAIYDLTGIYSVIDYNRAPEFKISLNPNIDGIKHEKNGDVITITIDSKSRIPEVGKLIDDLVSKEIEKGFDVRMPSSYYQLTQDEQSQLDDSVDTILVQNALSQIKYQNHKKLSHAELVQGYLSRHPIFLNLINKFPEQHINKPWLTDEQKKDLELIVKARNLIF